MPKPARALRFCCLHPFGHAPTHSARVRCRPHRTRNLAGVCRVPGEVQSTNGTQCLRPDRYGAASSKALHQVTTFAHVQVLPFRFTFAIAQTPLHYTPWSFGLHSVWLVPGRKLPRSYLPFPFACAPRFLKTWNRARETKPATTRYWKSFDFHRLKAQPFFRFDSCRKQQPRQPGRSR